METKEVLGVVATTISIAAAVLSTVSAIIKACKGDNTALNNMNSMAAYGYCNTGYCNGGECYNQYNGYCGDLRRNQTPNYGYINPNAWDAFYNQYFATPQQPVVTHTNVAAPTPTPTPAPTYPQPVQQVVYTNNVQETPMVVNPYQNQSGYAYTTCPTNIYWVNNPGMSEAWKNWTFNDVTTKTVQNNMMRMTNPTAYVIPTYHDGYTCQDSRRMPNTPYVTPIVYPNQYFCRECTSTPGVGDRCWVGGNGIMTIGNYYDGSNRRNPAGNSDVSIQVVDDPLIPIREEIQMPNSLSAIKRTFYNNAV